MLHIIDYGIGNLRSIEKAFEAVGVAPTRSDRIADIERADKLVLPGVGAFRACADELRARNLEEPILEAVEAGTPLLGVCVGMQLLFEVGEEFGIHQGLGLLPGRVVKFQRSYALETVGMIDDEPASEDTLLKIPHMGWNTLYARNPDDPLLDGISDGAFFYFVHSFHAAPADEADVLATTTYGTEFAAIVNRENVYGVQFHPEKSHRNGLRILRNFAHL